MSKDTIYREDAVKILTENVTFEFIEDKEWAITCLQNLSSADRPQGEWIDDEFLGQYRCSECDYYSVDEFDYCPNCGARMFVKDTNVPNKKGIDDE